MSRKRTASAGRPLKVAVIDDGICPDHPGIASVSGGVAIAGPPGPAGLNAHHEHLRPWSHATVCAALIQGLAPNAELYSVDIPGSSGTAHPAALVDALEWSIKQGMDIVNVSLGTIGAEYAAPLQGLCARAISHGLVLVAATHRGGLVSYPSAFPEVIGVGRDNRYQGYEYGYYPGRLAEFVCAGWDDLVNQIIQAARSPSVQADWGDGTSFAAPRLVANIAVLLERERGLDLPELKERLADRTTRLRQSRARRSPVEGEADPLAQAGATLLDARAWVRRVALYPFDRKVQPILAFSDQFPFRVDAVIDPVHTSAHGQDAGEVFGGGPFSVPVLPDFGGVAPDTDTLVIGHTGPLHRAWHVDPLPSALTWAADNGKNVFSFAPIEPHIYRRQHEAAAARGLRWCSPANLADQLWHVETTRLKYDIDVPVIAVLGTSANQGKLTTQLALRRHLRADGYRIVLVGSNPICSLLEGGITAMYDKRIPQYLPLDSQVSSTRVAMALAAQDHPDAIIAGAHGGLIPMSRYDLRKGDDPDRAPDLTLSALGFLMATEPDVIVLAVNATDDEDCIARTLAVAEAVSGKRVLALAMADKLVHRDPYSYKQRWGRTLRPEEIARLRDRLHSRFGLRLFCPQIPEDQTDLARLIVDTLAVE